MICLRRLMLPMKPPTLSPSHKIRLAAIDRLAATGTAESFLQCDDATKKGVFADWIEESARRKDAEQSRDALAMAAREVSEAWTRPDGSIAAAITALRSLIDAHAKDQTP